MFVTAEPTALVATCGGITGEGWTEEGWTSCLVLDPINQRWDASRMGNLTMGRKYPATATLDHIGVFIFGGSFSSRMTSDFLAAGTMQWQEGPALPDGMSLPCSVEITPTSFLVLYGTDIREFDAAIAGPTSNEGWREAGRWPALKTFRSFLPGCAKIGQKVIIAGGFNKDALGSTEVLDLVNKQVTSGGEMATPRIYFHINTIVVGREETLFALAGKYSKWDSTSLNSVEEWVEESSTWKAANNLVEKRYDFGAVAAPRHLVCRPL